MKNAQLMCRIYISVFRCKKGQREAIKHTDGNILLVLEKPTSKSRKKKAVWTSSEKRTKYDYKNPNETPHSISAVVTKGKNSNQTPKIPTKMTENQEVNSIT